MFGYMGTQDFFTTLLGLKTPIINFLGGFLAVLIKIAGFIYSSKLAVLILICLMCCDWITGIYKAIKLKKFNSFTFQRMIINIFFTMVVICFAYQLSMVLPLIAWLQLPEFLFGGFAVTYFFSIFENLHEVDSRLIPEKMYKWVKYVLDIDRIIPSYFKNIKPPIEKNENVDENNNPSV